MFIKATGDEEDEDEKNVQNNNNKFLCSLHQHLHIYIFTHVKLCRRNFCCLLLFISFSLLYYSIIICASIDVMNSPKQSRQALTQTHPRACTLNTRTHRRMLSVLFTFIFRYHNRTKENNAKIALTEFQMDRLIFVCVYNLD